MAIIAEQNKILDMSNKILKLLNKFFDTDMTKEDLRQEFQVLLKDWNYQRIAITREDK